MNSIQFTTVVGPDGVIRPPQGVKLPEGQMVVSICPVIDMQCLESRAHELAARRGLTWDTVPQELRAILIEDLRYEARGLRRPLPGPGACKGMILEIAADFDAPLQDMTEYME